MPVGQNQKDKANAAADVLKDKAQQDKYHQFLQELLKEEDNKYCADCGSKGPRWASHNLGVFLCIRCAGIHRNLGVHVSKVKSVNLDSWNEDQIGHMICLGNRRAHEIYEARLSDAFARPQTDASLEAFVRSKYEHKKYAHESWQQLVQQLPPNFLGTLQALRIDSTGKRRHHHHHAHSDGSPLAPPPAAGQKNLVTALAGGGKFEHRDEELHRVHRSSAASFDMHRSTEGGNSVYAGGNDLPGIGDSSGIALGPNKTISAASEINALDMLSSINLNSYNNGTAPAATGAASNYNIPSNHSRLAVQPSSTVNSSSSNLDDLIALSSTTTSTATGGNMSTDSILSLFGLAAQPAAATAVTMPSLRVSSSAQQQPEPPLFFNYPVHGNKPMPAQQSFNTSTNVAGLHEAAAHSSSKHHTVDSKITRAFDDLVKF